MEIFSFGKKNPPDEHSQVLGEQTTPPASTISTPPNGSTTSNLASAQSVAARAEASRLLETSPRRRGRPPKTQATGGGNSSNVSPELQAELAAQMDAIYAPEAWGALLSAPGDAVAAITGKERWEISKEERKTLGVTGSAAARVLMITNPRGLALLMVVGALFSTYVPRVTAELKDIAARKQAEKMKAKTSEKTTLQ